MFLGNLRNILGTSFLVSIGIGAFYGEKLISENGPQVIIEPVVTAMQKIRPLSDAVGMRVDALVDKMFLDAPVTIQEAARIASHVDSTHSEPAADVVDQLHVTAPQVPPIYPQTSIAMESVGDCVPLGRNTDVVVLGDRLSLRVFEQSTLASLPVAQSGTVGESIIFERLDLSGSYEVGADGAVSLPAIGRVDVIGRQLECVEGLIGRAISERLRVNASVSGAFALRPPILVNGAVRAPGSYAYSPGLTVERMLAQAGAIAAVEPLSTLQMASLTSREEELSIQEAGLVIERARFDAVQKGDYAFASDTDPWTPVAEALGADRVDSERILLRSQLDAQKALEEQSSKWIKDLEARIVAAREGMAVAEAQLAFLVEREENTQELNAKGVLNISHVNESTLRRMDMSRVVMDKRDDINALEGEMRMAQYDLAVRQTSRQFQLASAGVENSKARSIVLEQLRAVRGQLEFANTAPEQTFVVTIERPNAAGSSKFIAASDTFVRPGDLMIVKNLTERASPSEIISNNATSDLDSVITISSR